MCGSGNSNPHDSAMIMLQEQGVVVTASNFSFFQNTQSFASLLEIARDNNEKNNKHKAMDGNKKNGLNNAADSLDDSDDNSRAGPPARKKRKLEESDKSNVETVSSAAVPFTIVKAGDSILHVPISKLEFRDMSEFLEIRQKHKILKKRVESMKGDTDLENEKWAIGRDLTKEFAEGRMRLDCTNPSLNQVANNPIKARKKGQKT